MTPLYFEDDERLDEEFQDQEDDEDEEEEDEDQDEEGGFLEVEYQRELRSWRRFRYQDPNQLAFDFSPIEEESPTIPEEVDSLQRQLAAYLDESQEHEGDPELETEPKNASVSVIIITRGRTLKALGRLLRAHADELDDYNDELAKDAVQEKKSWIAVVVRESLGVVRLAFIQAVGEIVKHMIGILFRASSR